MQAAMLFVLRMGTRPPEKRDSVRFRANFAVEGRGDRTTAGHLGVTADISDHGCSLLWPDALDVGQRLPVRIHFGPRSMDWIAEVVGSQGRQTDAWYRYDVRFDDLTVADVDAINDMVFSVVVPDLLTTLTQPAWLVRQWRRLRLAVARHVHSRARRQVVRVPVRVRHAGGTFVTTVRDLSASGLSVQSPVPLPAGTEVTLTMVVPGHEWQGTASVARSEARVSRKGFDTWILGLRFEREQAKGDVAPFRRWDAA